MLLSLAGCPVLKPDLGVTALSHSSRSSSCMCQQCVPPCAGFVVCAYLVLACGLTVDDALACFAKARPPGVRHEKFVQELRRRYEPRRDADLDPSRSSMGSVHSDMATVAEFLGPATQQSSRCRP